jgi:hypothetical protein
VSIKPPAVDFKVSSMYAELEGACVLNEFMMPDICAVKI